MLTLRTWLDALRKPVEAGGYKPCPKHQLRWRDTFSPFGVACDLSGLGTWDGNRYACGDHEFYILSPDPIRVAVGLGTGNVCGSYDFMTLPEDLQREVLNLTAGRPGNELPESIEQLGTWGVPFPVIAKVIEARPEGLFESEAVGFV